MNDVKKWSKKIDTENISYKGQNQTMPLSQAVDYLQWLSKDIDWAVSHLVKDSAEEVGFLDFTVEPQYEEFGIYHETNYDEIYNLLKSLTDEGYDLRSEWRIFRDSLSTIWENLPEFYSELKRLNIDERILPEDYDPKQPFPQYPIPEDIEE